MFTQCIVVFLSSFKVSIVKSDVSDMNRNVLRKRC